MRHEATGNSKTRAKPKPLSDDVGCAKLGEMTADRLHGAAGEFGKTTRRGRSALVQENDELVDHRIAQQSTESRLAIFGFVHRQRCMAKRSTLSSTLPGFENSRNVEM
jgi:hypothetical protein